MHSKLNQVFVIFTVLFAITQTHANVISSKEEPQSCKNIDFVTRSKWDARMPIRIQNQITPLQYVLIHHTVTPTCITETKCSQLLKSMQNFHMEEREYHDIGYNFLIGGDGKIYEGVGFRRVGAHTRDYSTRSLVIAFIGSFQDKLPPQKQLQAAKDFLKCAKDLGEIDSGYKLIAARQVSATQSPGLRLYHELQNWSHFTKSPSQLKN